MQNHFVVMGTNGKPVITFRDAFSHDTYVLEMNHRENEILEFLLVMAVEIMLHGNN